LAADDLRARNIPNRLLKPEKSLLFKHALNESAAFNELQAGQF
jgi:hypothetical protein